MDVKEVAERIRYLRLLNDYSQEKVARDIQISLSAYKKLEGGINCPSLDTLLKLEMYYNTDLNYLVHGKSD